MTECSYSVQMAVECVIAPETIDIMLQDIGGLDNIVEQLVSRLCVTAGCMSQMQNADLSWFELQTCL